MSKSFEELIEIAISDGIITDKERELLLKKAEELGIDPIEAEIVIENYIEQSSNSLDEIDSYDISDEELLQRLNNLINKLGSNSTTEIEMKPFPIELKSGNKISENLNKAKKVIGKVTSSGIIKEASSTAGSFTKIPGSKFAGKLAGKGVETILHKIAGTETKKLTHLEILELASRYMFILETRAQQSSVLKNHHIELAAKLKYHQENIPKKKGWF